MGMASGAYEGDKERARQAEAAARLQIQAQQNEANNRLQQQRIDQHAYEFDANHQMALNKESAANDRMNRELDMKQQTLDFEQGMKTRAYEDARNAEAAQRNARQKQIFDEYSNLVNQGRRASEQRKSDIQSGIGSAMKLSAENGGAMPSYILPGINRQLGLDGRTAAVVGGGYTMDGTFFMDFMRMGPDGRAVRTTEQLDLLQQAKVIGQLTGIFNDTDRLTAVKKLQQRGFRDSEIINAMGFDATNLERAMQAEQSISQSHGGLGSVKDYKALNEHMKTVNAGLKEHNQFLRDLRGKIINDKTAQEYGYKDLKEFNDELLLNNKAQRAYYRNIAGMVGVQDDSDGNNVSGHPGQNMSIADRNAGLKVGEETVDSVTGKRIRRVENGIVVIGNAERGGKQTETPKVSGNPNQTTINTPQNGNDGFSASDLTGVTAEDQEGNDSEEQQQPVESKPDVASPVQTPITEDEYFDENSIASEEETVERSNQSEWKTPPRKERRPVFRSGRALREEEEAAERKKMEEAQAAEREKRESSRVKVPVSEIEGEHNPPENEFRVPENFALLNDDEQRKVVVNMLHDYINSGKKEKSSEDKKSFLKALGDGINSFMNGVGDTWDTIKNLDK